MRPLIVTLFCISLLFAGSAASAQETYPPTRPPSVEGSSGGDAGTAFTGDDLTSPAALAAACLLVAGGLALYVARRRAQRLEGSSS